MKNKSLLIAAIETLLFSWGMDTPPEAIWGLNELLDFIENEYDVSIPERFQEEGFVKDASEKNEELLHKITSLL